jgi:hypothetical protein
MAVADPTLSPLHRIAAQRFDGAWIQRGVSGYPSLDIHAQQPLAAEL